MNKVTLGQCHDPVLWLYVLNIAMVVRTPCCISAIDGWTVWRDSKPWKSAWKKTWNFARKEHAVRP
jgi:hypothetical protein